MSGGAPSNTATRKCLTKYLHLHIYCTVVPYINLLIVYKGVLQVEIIEAYIKLCGTICSLKSTYARGLIFSCVNGKFLFLDFAAI